MTVRRVIGSVSRLAAVCSALCLLVPGDAASQATGRGRPRPATGSTAPAAAPPPAGTPVPVEVQEQPDAYLLSGIAKRQQGKYREAIDDLTIYVTGKDRDPDGHFELALACALFNEARPVPQIKAKAIEHFRKCYELSPSHPRRLPSSARPSVVALLQEGRKQAGVAGDLSESRPVDAEGLLRLAETQVDSGDLLEAKKNYDEIKEIPPPPAPSERERVRNKLDRLFRDKVLKIQSLEVSNLNEAQNEAASLLRFFPDEPVALETYVRLQMRYSKLAMEGVATQKIYQSYRNNIEGFMLKSQFREALGEVNRMLFNFPRADFAERKYQEIQQKNEAALQNALDTYKAGRFEEARKKFEDIRRDYPDPGPAQDAISEIDDVRRKLESDLDRSEERGSWAALYATAKELTAKFPAHARAKEAIQTALKEVSTRVAAGKELVTAGKTFEAIQSFEKALTIVPEQSEAQEGIAAARAAIRESRKKLWAGLERIPAGRYILGGGDGPDTKPKNKNATLGEFFLDHYKVTNAQYEAYVLATGARAPEPWKGPAPPADRSDFAVSGVSYPEADAYCRWLGKRLPTEFEWEKAARGPEGLDLPYENAPGSVRKSYNPFVDQPVTKWPALASPYRIEALHGPIWEWTSSWYAPYPGNDDASLRAVPKETFRSVRGGARTFSGPATGKALPVTERDRRSPDKKDPDLGFRCAASSGTVPELLENVKDPEKVPPVRP